MKVRVLVLSLFLTSLTFGAESYNQLGTTVSEPRHEIGAGLAPVLGFGGRATGAELYTDFDGTPVISIAGNYNYAFTNFLQLGLAAAWAHGNGDVLQVIGGPTLNIPFGSDWLYNSLFVSAMGGFVYASTGSTNALLVGDVGYRLKIVEHVTWRPSVGIFKTLDGSKFMFAFRAFSISFVF